MRLVGPDGEGTPRRLRALADEIWTRVKLHWERAESDRVREQEESAGLLAELMAAPREEREALVASAARFQTLGLTDLLIEQALGSARCPGGGRERCDELPELALAVARRLDRRRYGTSAPLRAEAVAWSLWAESQRRRGDLKGAESAFRYAVRRLVTEPHDIPERAVYCRRMASLRRDQGWIDEALCLLQGAARLFEQWGWQQAAGEASSERGWICLAEGDATSALVAFEEAVERLESEEGWPRAKVRARHGLALCLLELAQPEEAARSLTAARELYPLLSDPVEQLRFAVVEARLEDAGGDAERALDTLGRALRGFIAREAYADAAVAAVEMAQLHAALGKPAAIERLWQEVALLAAPGVLPEEQRAVVLFAFRFALRGEGCDPFGLIEVLARAAEHLEQARESPGLTFDPLDEPAQELLWDELDPEARRRLCAEAGVPAAVAELPAIEVPLLNRRLLAWTHLELAGARVVFSP